MARYRSPPWGTSGAVENARLLLLEGIGDGQGTVGRGHAAVFFPGAPGARFDVRLCQQPGAFALQLDEPDVHAFIKLVHIRDNTTILQ